MRRLPPLFAYRSAATPLHRVPAGIKLAAMCALTPVAFAIPLRYLALMGLMLGILFAISRTELKTILRNIAILFWYALFIAVFRITGKPLNTEVILRELTLTGTYIARLAVVLAIGTLFYETTSTLEIKRVLERVQTAVARPFAPVRSRVSRFTGRTIEFPNMALLLSLTISFIPRIFDVWTALTIAWEARGGSTHRGISGSWRRLTTLVPLLVVRLLSIAADTDRALRNRSR